MQVFKNIHNTLLIAVLLIVATIVLLLASPIIAIFFLLETRRSTRDDEEFNRYLAGREGGSFFAYNNKLQTKRYVEEHILPHLPPQINVIFLDGTTPESGLPLAYASKLLYRCYTPGGMPYVIVIANGQPVATSVNNQLYSAIQHNDPGRVLQRISELTAGEIGATGD